MSRFTLYTPETADEAARETLVAVEEMVGFLPNVVAVLGASPHQLQALVALNMQFAASGLTPVEREIVQLAVSVQNRCGYCVAGHSAFGADLGMPESDIAALRADRPLPVVREEALRRFAGTLAAGKGHASDADYDAFLKAGYTAEQAVDVILGVSVKMYTNMLSILLRLPLDDKFKPYAWSPDETRRTGVAA